MGVVQIQTIVSQNNVKYCNPLLSQGRMRKLNLFSVKKGVCEGREIRVSLYGIFVFSYFYSYILTLSVSLYGESG